MTTRTDEGDRWLVERKTSDTTWETVYDFRARFTYLTYSANETADRELHRIVTGENLPDGVYRLTITAHPDFNPAPAAVLAQWEAEFPEPPGWAELNNADRGLAHNLLRGGWVYANGVGSERRTYPGVTREQLA
ncbi:MAG: hypothetical protein J2P26_01845, partial [Nocardiopsaceae bacterium]|nr:hypothetical protein [Nocardiopsaceae bacterium]